MTTKTVTISGNTFKCPTQLKSEGFKFDGSAKTWSREVNVDDNGNIFYGAHLQGDAKSYEHHWRCYAKGNVTIVLSY